MLVKVNTSVIEGCQAQSVTVECDITKPKKPTDFRFDLIGLADIAIKEARTRVLSALTKSQCSIKGKILVNLAPAEIKKDGASLDLSIAVALLTSIGRLKPFSPDNWFYGELALDGSVKPIKGLIAHILVAVKNKAQRVFIPRENLLDVSCFENLEVIPISKLRDLFSYQKGEIQPVPVINKAIENKSLVIFQDIVGQEIAKRAMSIAAAGGHNLLMVGPPGCGKSMLAERFSLLLSDLNYKERLESAAIHSVVGSDLDKLIIGIRPFRSPHYSISEVGLIGGGSKLKPGEISLAHHGVLFLDELPEYKRNVIEALRLPLEKQKININRAKYSHTLPAKFQLITAMNPCPCGKLGVIKQDCTCTSSEISRYLSKVSEPILDRIDLQVSLQPVDLQKIYNHNSGQSEKQDVKIREKVLAAQQQAMIRQNKLNSDLNNQELKTTIQLSKSADKLLDQIAVNNQLTARGYFRMLKTALTIADLNQSKIVTEVEISEASSYRSLDLIRQYAQT